MTLEGRGAAADAPATSFQQEEVALNLPTDTGPDTHISDSGSTPAEPWPRRLAIGLPILVVLLLVASSLLVGTG